MSDQIDASPAKRFFVEMLTRDIELKDAILDLLDNCVDGVMRSNANNLRSEKPYEGYEARINFDKSSFEITDNCGGIPRDVALSRAFRMGRPSHLRDIDADLPTVGIYGIGMKRAMFKMGKHSLVRSHASDASYSVEILPSWIDHDTDWNLNVKTIRKTESLGTKIIIKDLYPGISRLLSDATGFDTDLKKSISAYYGSIIQKGFSVFVNEERIEPQIASFLLDANSFRSGKGILPYIYTGEYKGVSIELVVGFYRNPPSAEEQDEALAGRPRTEQAGWTVICNDRVVLYADKTKVTGWGEAGVPSYHTQFVSIAGIVNLRANNAALLPVTTTKRGIDGNSEVYLSIKEFMREGLKVFTDNTNKWKGPRPELASAPTNASTSSIAAMVPGSKWSQDKKSIIKGKKFKPELPVPSSENDTKVIRFFKPIKDIKKLGEHYFDDANAAPSEIGSACFDDILKDI